MRSRVEEEVKAQEGLEEAARSKLQIALFSASDITDHRNYREEEWERNSLVPGVTKGLILILMMVKYYSKPEVAQMMVMLPVKVRSGFGLDAQCQ